MLFNLFILGVIALLTFTIYYVDMRKECRCIAAIATMGMVAATVAIWYFVKEEGQMQMWVKGAVLAMVAFSIPARYWFGASRRSVYREHHIKTTRFLPW
ncbi:hypothetical protein AEAC466_06605 [Asticcacaulis sp. AC466]|uniref:hypothetical protein n=1 Tax=Asticcacaulis sp. AC466 TaxID=1282362 RepID=UPI0003C3B226|nr:hypothetical protein [Asticcacaulis sp. AC466]ESQ84720.1 hypothetical protein AEAC466_06605 [Asticcacaulis sp. AC466]